MNSQSFKPAILGGSPVVSSGLPTWPISDASIHQVFQNLSSSGEWGQYDGENSHKLIAELSKYYSSEQIVLTSSGTSAVELALRGLNVSTGDEVILAAYDFKSNFTNIALLGATPVLIDIREENAQLDIALVNAAISEKTKAIIASHLHGGLIDMRHLRSIADEHHLQIVEDCCQLSPLAKIDGKTIGGSGDVSTLSFGGSKLLTAGRGGAVISHDPQISQRMKLYQERGNTAYPLSEMQAAVLLPQLKSLPDRHRARVEFVSTLQKELSSDRGLKLFQSTDAGFPDYYKLGMWYDSEHYQCLSREHFCKAMRAEGIPIDPGFSALHKIHARRRFRKSGKLIFAEQAHDRIVILHHPFLLGGETAACQFLQALDKIKDHATILEQQVPVRIHHIQRRK